MAANRASFPRYAGEQPQGLRRGGMGVSLQIAHLHWHRPHPRCPLASLSPRGRGKEQISDHGNKLH